MTDKEFLLEDAFAELDGIIRQLEKSDIRLADSMDLYKKGVELLEKCQLTLDQTEKEIIIIQEGQKVDK